MPRYAQKEMSLEDIFNHVTKSKKEDVVSERSNVRAYLNEVEDERRQLRVQIGNDYDLPVNRYAQGQLNRIVGEGFDTYSKSLLESSWGRELYIHNINQSMAKAGGRSLFRTMSNGDPAHVRAVVSDSFLPIDDDLLLPDLLEIVGSKADRWKSIGGFPTDSRTYLKFAERQPSFSLNINGATRDFFFAFIYSNSEVGDGYMKLTASIIDGYCQNGMMFTKAVIADAKFVHRGARITTDFGPVFEDRIQKDQLLNIRSIVRDAAQIAVGGYAYDGLRNTIEQSVQMKIEGRVSNVADAVFKRAGLTSVESEDAKVLLGAEDRSVFGLQAAVTKLAQQSPTYERRIELEAAGASILETTPKTWSAIQSLSQ